MLKPFTIFWMFVGLALGAAYINPSVQRSLEHAKALELVRVAQAARGRARMVPTGTDLGPEAQADAKAQWQRTLEAADAALVAFPDASSPAKTLAHVLKAEALAQTGNADQAYKDLVMLEQQADNGRDKNALEAIQATLAKTSYQIALMVRKESSDDDAWIKYSETACAYYQQLLKEAIDEATADVYRKNLACVTRFRYGADDPMNCWSMPPLQTVDCKKKMRRIDREMQRGGKRAPRYNKPLTDNDDPLRRKAVEDTRQGKDEGK